MTYGKAARKVFELTDEHITLLRNAGVTWDDTETGAPQIDPKRPYGNSDVALDVCEILEWPQSCNSDNGYDDASLEAAMELHKETETALQIVLYTGEFKPGWYENTGYGINWEHIPER